MLMPKIAEDT